MRTTKELLEMMLENHQCFRSGLCSWVIEIHYGNLITGDEYIGLIAYIKNNRPNKYSSFDAYTNRYSNFYWEKSNIKPRIKWIKKHIKKLS